MIPINVPGFAGPKNLGNKLGAEALLDDVIGTVEPEFTTPCDINIVGDYNVSGELWKVKPLFDALGLRVLACISGDARYNEVAARHRARVNMAACSKAMIDIATRMEQRYGIPYFEGAILAPEIRARRQARGDEVDHVRLLLLAHADPAAGPFAECAAVAGTVAIACLGDNHLWQDLQLNSRAELSAPMRRWFPALVVKNSADLKWKKFFYRQL